MSRPTPQSLSTSSGQDELREQARLVKQMMALPVRENSSALVTVDLWEIADFIAHHTQEAVEAATQEYQTEYEQRHIASAIRVARKDELERLYRVAHRGNFYDAEIHYRIAELSAPQQSSSPDGSTE